MADLVCPSIDTICTDRPGWAVRLVSVGADSPCADFAGPGIEHRRYVCITLAFAAHGPAPVELRPESVVLVFTGLSPLNGLARQPVLFQAGSCVASLPPSEAPAPFLVSPGCSYLGTFVFEFPVECREFRLYFGNCEAIPILTGM